VSACAAGVALERLVDYWRDRTAPVHETLEDHVSACDACTTRLAWLAALGE
jgi:hypothetical protein